MIRCPVDEKLIAKFQGSWAQGTSMYETVLYAHMKTFRQESGSLDFTLYSVHCTVYIPCSVHTV